MYIRDQISVWMRVVQRTLSAADVNFDVVLHPPSWRPSTRAVTTVIVFGQLTARCDLKILRGRNQLENIIDNLHERVGGGGREGWKKRRREGGIEREMEGRKGV